MEKDVCKEVVITDLKALIPQDHFADAKEKHGMRYTQHRCLARVTAWVRLKYAANTVLRTPALAGGFLFLVNSRNGFFAFSQILYNSLKFKKARNSTQIKIKSEENN